MPTTMRWSVGLRHLTHPSPPIGRQFLFRANQRRSLSLVNQSQSSYCRLSALCGSHQSKYHQNRHLVTYSRRLDDKDATANERSDGHATANQRSDGDATTNQRSDGDATANQRSAFIHVHNEDQWSRDRLRETLDSLTVS